MKSLIGEITKKIIEKHTILENNSDSKSEDNKKTNKKETNRKILRLLSWLPYKDPDLEIFEVKKIKEIKNHN